MRTMPWFNSEKVGIHRDQMARPRSQHSLVLDKPLVSYWQFHAFLLILFCPSYAHGYQQLPIACASYGGKGSVYKA